MSTNFETCYFYTYHIFCQNFITDKQCYYPTKPNLDKIVINHLLFPFFIKQLHNIYIERERADRERERT